MPFGMLALLAEMAKCQRRNQLGLEKQQYRCAAALEIGGRRRRQGSAANEGEEDDSKHAAPRGGARRTTVATENQDQK